MNEYLDALSDPEPDAARVMSSLLQYVKTEHKDRVHAINRYEHVEQTDPVAGETQRATVAAHLRGIDERVTQAIDMLSRLPRFEKKIRSQIERFLSNYQSLDESLAVIMAKINEKSNRTPGKHATTEGHLDEQTTIAIPLEEHSTVVTKPSNPESTTGAAIEEGKSTTSTVMLTSIPRMSGAMTGGRGYVAVKQVMDQQQHVAHQQKDDFAVLESYIQKIPVRTERGGHLAAPLAIAVCGVAVFVLVVAGIAMARRGRAAGPSADSLSVTEIDRNHAATAPAQVNGYENPTYQYYQAAESAVAAAVQTDQQQAASSDD